MEVEKEEAQNSKSDFQTQLEESLKNFDAPPGTVLNGIVNVRFARDPGIVPDQPVKILGKICTEDKKIYLEGRAVYQSVNDGFAQ